MSLNDHRNEAADFLRMIGAGGEHVEKILGWLDEELLRLRQCMTDRHELAHRVYDVMFLLFELAATHNLDLDKQWTQGRRRKQAKYGPDSHPLPSPAVSEHLSGTSGNDELSAPQLTTLLRDLETRLLQPDVRRSPAKLDRLLADEFLEFTSSGNTCHKQQCVGGMSAVDMVISDFQARLQAPGVALATYRVAKRDGKETKHSLRSSIWKLIEGRWQMVFHQGTPHNPRCD